MKRASSYIIATAIAILASIPPKFIQITCELNTTVYQWASIASGFLTIMFAFTKANSYVKVLVIYAYIGCFLSRAPYLSFTIYFSVIGCAYLYLLCLSIEDWEPIFRTIQSLFLLSVLFIIMQRFDKDTLLNFGKTDVLFMGTIFNSMQLASYIVCLTPFLLLKNKLYIIPILILASMSRSGGMMLSVASGAIFYTFFKIRNKVAYAVIAGILILGTLTYAYRDNNFKNFFEGGGARYPVWKKTVQLLNENPWSGFGIGTYKVLFPVLSGQMIDEDGGEHTWLRAHNDWVQFPFELGYVGFSIVLGLVGYLIWLFKRAKKTDPVILAMSGLIIYGVNMTVHFPGRLTQSALIILCYIAFYERHYANQNS